MMRNLVSFFSHSARRFLFARSGKVHQGRPCAQMLYTNLRLTFVLVQFEGKTTSQRPTGRTMANCNAGYVERQVKPNQQPAPVIDDLEEDIFSELFGC